jgi:hypothetical protein
VILSPLVFLGTCLAKRSPVSDRRLRQLVDGRRLLQRRRLRDGRRGVTSKEAADVIKLFLSLLTLPENKVDRLSLNTAETNVSG